MVISFRHSPMVDTDRTGKRIVREWSRSKPIDGRVYFAGAWHALRETPCRDCAGTGNRARMVNPPAELNPGSCETCSGNGCFLEVVE